MKSIIRNKRTFLLQSVMVICLALGLTAFIFIANYVYFEWSFNRHIPNHEQVYRLTNGFNGKKPLAISAFVIGPALQQELPEITESLRTTNWHVGQLAYTPTDNEPVSQRVDFLWADANIVDMLSLNLLQGGDNFSNPDRLLITPAIAEQYFGDHWENQSPIGKSMTINTTWGPYEMIVDGIVAPQPSNSTISYGVIGNIDRVEANFGKGFGQIGGITTYLKFQKGIKPSGLASKIEAFKEDKMPDLASITTFGFQPLTDIYFTEDIDFDFGRRGNWSVVQVMFTLLIMVLVLCFSNFVNFSIASENYRLKQYGIKAILGAHKTRLVGEYFKRTSFIILVSVLLSVIFYWFIREVLFDYLDLTIAWTFSVWQSIIFIMTLFVVTTILVGTYPAFILQKSNPLQLAINHFHSIPGKVSGRKMLLVIQFAIALLALSATWATNRQFNFIQDKEMGFQKEGILQISMNDQQVRSKAEVLQQTVDQLSIVNQTTITNRNIFDETAKDQFSWHGDSVSGLGLVNYLTVDDNFFEVFDIDLIAGRKLDADRTEDVNQHFMVNEAFSRLLGFENPAELVGQRISTGRADNERTGYIVGVLEDYHYRSIHQGIEPLVLMIRPGSFQNVLSIAYQAGKEERLVEALEDIWADLSIDAALDYSFLEDHIMNAYSNEDNMKKFIGLMNALLWILIFTGFLGLLLFEMRQKEKELGIRKILGARFGDDFWLLMKRQLWLLLIAMGLSIPLAYHGINLWLEDFVYHTSISIGIFLFPSLSLLAGCAITVMVSLLVLERQNPVHALRQE